MLLAIALLAEAMLVPDYWTELTYVPGTNVGLTVYHRAVQNQTEQMLVISAYTEQYNPRQECWESENRTVPSSAPDWQANLATLYPEAGVADMYFGPAEDNGEAFPAPLWPGGSFSDSVTYDRSYGKYQRFEWNGNHQGSQQTTTRRRDLWFEYFIDRDYSYNPNVPPGETGGGGG